jgi:GNAT superfamily N-acetyltransferase
MGSRVAIIARMPIADTHLETFTAWSRGWAITREVAPPVPHADGLRIEVGMPRQLRRYVFPQASPALRALGETVTEPWVFLKACATSDELRALLLPRWQMQDEHFLMTCGDRTFGGSGAVAPGYTLQVEDTAATTRRAHVAVHAADGALAASGHLALDERFAIYDRIVTEPAHQRRGLGRAVMHALQALARAHGRHANVLVATAEGRTLYETLGWRLHAPWATAVIPGADEPAG